MLTRQVFESGLVPPTTREAVMQHLRPSTWHMIALASLVAGVGAGWRILTQRPDLYSPTTAAFTMVIAVFAGWYVWGFFTHFVDVSLFGGHADYKETLHVFGRAYVFQAVIILSVAEPLGWLWGWIALYLTVAAWSALAPRYLGMRTWRALVTSTCGMLLWLACVLIASLILQVDGIYLGLGAFLV